MALPAGHVEGFADTFRALFSQVYDAIEAGSQDTYPSFADGHDALLVTEAVAESHATGSWTSVEW